MNNHILFLNITLYSTDELFEIEQIVKERGRKNKKEVLVKWKGYDEPTWIPKEDIVDIS